MADLKGDVLLDKLKENILYALSNAKQPDIKITFRFIITDDYICTEKINVFAGGFTYKNVYFGFNTLVALGLTNKDECIYKFGDKYTDLCIAVILDNLHYDVFSHIDTIEHYGDSSCHGHGEYWGTDSFTFVYKRLDK